MIDVDQNLSANFKLREFLRSDYASRHGLTIYPSTEEVENLRRLCVDVLQPVRDRYGRMRITSGLRPHWLNTAIGGSKSSAHMYGCAADVEFLDYDNSYVFEHLRYYPIDNFEFDQIINEFPPDGWIHFGIARVGAISRHQFLIARQISGKTVYESA
jgi:zinc D-Ala-D-Ala carboxypeptidase